MQHPAPPLTLSCTRVRRFDVVRIERGGSLVMFGWAVAAALTSAIISMARKRFPGVARWLTGAFASRQLRVQSRPVTIQVQSWSQPQYQLRTTRHACDVSLCTCHPHRR